MAADDIGRKNNGSGVPLEGRSTGLELFWSFAGGAKLAKPGTVIPGPAEVVRLENLDVFGLEALRAPSNGEFNRLAFLQAAESVRLNRRKMHEDIFAVLAADEAESLRVVKPLYCSLFHCVVPVFLNFLLRRSVAAWSG